MDRLTLMVATSVLVTAAHAASSAPPKFDINAACRDAAATHDSATREDAIKFCLDSETKARNEIEEKWSRYNPALRDACVASSSIGGVKPVYSELISCIEMKH
jgi:hypothetical protein